MTQQQTAEVLDMVPSQGAGGYQVSPAKAVQEIAQQVEAVQGAMKKIMQNNTHYGVIPGTDKPTLLKPGAEVLRLMFNLAPKIFVERHDLPGGHREYEVTTELYGPGGQFVGAGVGAASTMETKYRFRRAELKCPQCGKETIIKGKARFGGGWVCWKKKGGCGTQFHDNDPKITGQKQGRVEYDNPADYYNTVLKMAKKRSFIDAILTATAASDIFTQDVEDLRANGALGAEPEPQQQEAQPQGESGGAGQKSQRGADKQPPKEDAGPPPEGFDFHGGGSGEEQAHDGGTPDGPATQGQIKAIQNLCKQKGFRESDHLWDGMTYAEAVRKIHNLNEAKPSKKGGA